ncbi:uncharacterized protein L3040_004733 [Drepanopeziza brunnea f. sp. 'multigermtubi']|uniref:Rad4 family protein n=1 Tax=Marssonina brunnea f. sp. multigermtubi (strain MB_m1) TaxID=1072389 RepID=K1WZ95_MARBU|nr:Rad4 family protein [Drepanopeziza brunnea f. sp. 'multigermtubi' MB_m1]EKD18311.1 Rad4 family protein [Drepanopeziza brunnea f. sp. 'multigermtubi' MB_m1]KAJ5042177.1 hypothetical protein L3040_004733 [Drepanopeziza brunnea f. sp. 'multigermtubi']
MPPFLPRKRLRSESLEAGPSNPAPARGKAKSKTTTPRKPTLFDDLDAGTGSKRSATHKKAILEKLAAGDEDDESSLSSLSEPEFEDVPVAKRQRPNEEEGDDDDDDEDDEEDMEFEDVETNPIPRSAGPEPSGDLELVLHKDDRVSITNPLGSKKGPSKIERGIRVATHQMHVQALMFHNALRNAWCCDKELQEILVKQLSPREAQAVEKWRRDSGLASREDVQSTGGKGKGKAKAAKGKKADPRSQRDWGEPAGRLAEGTVNMSAGDPLFTLMKHLMKYWRTRFSIQAPGLRKLGYMSLQRLDEETKSFKEDEHDPERHGERIRNLKEFRKCAEAMEGSRDVSSQLFTGLLRGLGIEARLVASLQPLGFGWSQVEEAMEKNPRVLKVKKTKKPVDIADHDPEDDTSSSGEDESCRPANKGKGPAKPTKLQKPTPRPGKPSRDSGVKEAPIDLSDSEDLDVDSDGVEDVTPRRRPAKRPDLAYDTDLPHPHYWTEVLSPVTNTYTPVDPVVLHVCAYNQQLVEKFETRGAKSEKAKQVTAYIIGHSPDGTAKDVTTRYLKRHVWPGRTKGFRLPVEKVPVYNRHGKVKRYEQKDWFKQVMSGYVRGSKKCPRTEVDDDEEAADLKPVKAERKEVEEGKETLQYYKSSPDFVLERHLKREEALLPEAQHVKMFTVKGKGEASTEEKVFRRKDVVNCKTIETWHKEGRAPKEGEQPLKRVPYRAATTNRRRELAEAEHASGEKVLQGLYSREQTDWIIPPPIENGVIPKNAFGNIDLYVDSMLPAGAVHIPLRATVKICKRLEIDYAEAVVGFEFGHRMAVPIISGVVVAEEHHDTIMEEWHKEEAERVRKEDEKSRKMVLHTWRKMLMGLRIVERVRGEFGDADEEADVLNPWTREKKQTADDREAEAQEQIMDRDDEDMAGGFLPEGFDAEETEPPQRESFFPVTREDEDEESGGGFVVENYEQRPKAGQAYATPQSLEISSKGGAASGDDAGTGDEKATTPAPKKRGRPAAGSSSSKTATKPIAKRPLALQKPAGKGKQKQKQQMHDLENYETDDLSSPPPLDEGESEEEEEPPQKKRRHAISRAKATDAAPRRTPRRQAARKSETALKSHYFEHDDEDEDE